MLKKFLEEDFIKEMIDDIQDDEDGLIEPESHTDHSPAHSIGKVHSPTNEVQETSTEDRTPSEQTVTKEAHIQSFIHESTGNAAPNLSQDPALTNLRARRVKAPSLNRSQSSRCPVYLLSLRNKGRIVTKAKLVITDDKREIGGSMLGKEYVGVYVKRLENVDSRNKGDELIPRPIFDIRTLADAIGYVIPWPVHIKKLNLNQPGTEQARDQEEMKRKHELKQPGDVAFQGRMRLRWGGARTSNEA